MPEMVSSIESFRPVTSIAIRLIAQKLRPIFLYDARASTRQDIDAAPVGRDFLVA